MCVYVYIYLLVSLSLSLYIYMYANTHAHAHIFTVETSLVKDRFFFSFFNAMSTFVDYLMPKPSQQKNSSDTI